MCDKYNGWKNRETWALNLWLSNDEGLYNWTRERAAEAAAHYDATARADLATNFGRARTVGDAIKAFWDEITDPDEQLINVETILSMVRDIGSDYRVDWDEIGAAWLEDAS